MKKNLLTLIAVILMAGTSCQEKIDLDKEKEAIINVIEEERDAYYDRDVDRISATWNQESSSRKIYMSAKVYNEFIGWAEVSKQNNEQINAEFWNHLEDPEAKYVDFNINIYGNSAMVFHGAKFSGVYKGEKYQFEDKRILHMVKVDGEWKFDLMARYAIPEEEESESEETE